MLSADDNENKPIGKPGQRKAKTSDKTGAKPEPGKKGEPRKRKEAQSSIPKPDQLLEALQRLGAQGDDAVSAPILEQVSVPIAEEASAPVTSTESSATEPALPESNLREVKLIPAARPAEATSVSLQAIADAYGDYSKTSLEQTSTFVAKLATTRSLTGALELQTAFAREAYETFVAQSRRIRELHRELAKDRLTRLEGFMMGATKTR